ncbi:hypothetical protein GCM10007989_07610 [Devosia pacifica]|uniref:Uncharacterized protein n=1 Tax=Devosia pacifica TaxID=1335967 RepID=A0A918VQD0_9HYPH|nr:hypothetical protein [Devosia pacifica]GHA15321.1 hypothetical protein GCM10007989_07610 [Devosia pacifica]
MTTAVSQFWMVWSPQGGAPTKKHHVLDLAHAEARRLSSTCPGAEFYVLEAVAGYHLPKPGPEKITIVSDDGIPF